MPDSPGVTIISRAAWGARPPERRYGIETPTAELYLHHFAAASWLGASGMRRCQNFHMDTNGWSDFAYSFGVDIITGDIFEGRGPGIAGGHTYGRNTVSSAIAITGNAHTRKPSAKCIQNVAALAAHGQKQGWWGDWTGGHRDAPGASTACPGQYGYQALTDIKALTAVYMGQNQEDDDVKFTRDEAISVVGAAFRDIAGRTVDPAPANWVGAVEADARKLFQLHRLLMKEQRMEEEGRLAHLEAQIKGDRGTDDDFQPRTDDEIVAVVRAALSD